MMDEALRLAELGYRVFPLKPGTKFPITAHGVKDATADVERVAEWWSKFPDAGIGLCAAGMLIVDIDGIDNEYPNSPEKSLDAPCVMTPRGGRHYYFKLPTSRKWKNSVGLLAPRVDVRTSGGYVVAPPSEFDGGGVWQWAVPIDVPPEELPEPPAWLIAELDALEVAPREKNAAGKQVPTRVPEGGRNAALTSAAGTMRYRGMSEAEIEAALRIFNRDRCIPPVDDSELLAIVKSVARYEPTSPIVREAAVATRPTRLPGELKDCTDAGNAARFREHYADDLLYCAEQGKWYQWDGTRWIADNGGRVMRAALDVTMAMKEEARKLEEIAVRQGDEEKQKIAKEMDSWARKSRSESRLNAMINVAAAEMEVGTDQFDANQWLLNVRNGILNLKTGELSPHDRARMMTKIAGTDYDAAADCPKWTAFLARIFDGNTDVINFLQTSLGMMLTGDITEQYLQIWYGGGQNGKSTLVDTIKAVMGDYAGDSPPSLLTVRGQNEHPTELATLLGRRVVFASETEAGEKLKIALVKRLTGDSEITARYMRQDYFTFRRTHKMILMTNNKPSVRETTRAVWRRLRLVPFNVRISEKEKDSRLLGKLLDEMPGILSWCMAGCLNWQKSGLGFPEAVMSATRDYEADQDPLKVFLAECCELGSSCYCTRMELYNSYRRWCETTKEDWPMGKIHFFDAIRLIDGVHEVRDSTGSSVRGFSGIEVVNANG